MRFLPNPCKGCGFGGVRAGLGHRTHILYKDRLGLFHWEPSRVDVNIQRDEKFKLKAMCVKFRGEKRTMCPLRRTERCPGGAQDPTRTAALQNRRKGSAEHLPRSAAAPEASGSAGPSWCALHYPQSSEEGVSAQAKPKSPSSSHLLLTMGHNPGGVSPKESNIYKCVNFAVPLNITYGQRLRKTHCSSQLLFHAVQFNKT